MPAPALRVLLSGLIDYAGLFPPAELTMADAAARYARDRAGERAWMLGRFIVPLARLDELAAVAAPHLAAGGAPWRVSVLAGPDAAAARARIDAFERDQRRDQHRDGAGLAVEAVEIKAARRGEVAHQVPAYDGLACYVEIPHDDDPRPLLEALAAHGAAAKIRTGGVTEAAIPATAAVARFIAAAIAAGVPFKATAGLHHPLRGAYRLTYRPDSPRGTLFGFLNVFMAAALARTGLAAEDLEAVLEERTPSAFAFDHQGAAWRRHRVGLADLEATRAEAAHSYGSCSFDEPVEDLEALGLLAATQAPTIGGTR